MTVSRTETTTRRSPERAPRRDRLPGDPAGALALTASLEGPAGAPVLVLGNSLGTSRGVWAPQLPALASRFRLLRYELPGHGGESPAASARQPPAGPAVLASPRSARQPSPGAAGRVPPGPYSLDDLGGAVLALMDGYGIGRASYCGISLGGMIGIWLAAHAPDRIAALGLCCTSAWLPPAPAWLQRAATVRSSGMAAITGPVLGRWFTPAFARSSPAAVARIEAMLAGTVPEGYAGCCEAIAAMDQRPALGSISAPTLVIAASEDPATPPAHGALIARGIPGARLTVIRGAAHLASVQAPGPVTAALLAHLSADGKAPAQVQAQLMPG